MLYDANVWLALAFASHPHSRLATEHFERRDAANPAAFCRATQLAFLRLLTTPAIHQAYGSGPISNAQAWAKCQELLALPQVRWLNEPSDLDELWQTFACLNSASPKVWMDAYLAAFAIRQQVEFVTLDRDFRCYESSGLNLQLLKVQCPVRQVFYRMGTCIACLGHGHWTSHQAATTYRRGT